MSSRRYGYRRVDAELRHRGRVVNPKKVRRLMREHDLNPRRSGVSSRRPTAITTSRSPPIVARDSSRRAQPALGGRHHLRRHHHRLRLRRGDPRCLVTPGRRLRDRPQLSTPGYAVAALKPAIARRPPCRAASSFRPRVAIRLHRSIVPLAAHGLVGSMGRRGNPYDNAKAESFMKTLKVEAVYLDGLRDLRRRRRRPSPLHRRGLQRRRLHSALGYLSPHPVRGSPRPHPCQNRRLILSTLRGALQIHTNSAELSPSNATSTPPCAISNSAGCREGAAAGKGGRCDASLRRSGHLPPDA